MEGEARDEYRDQVVTCDVGVSLYIPRHIYCLRSMVMAQVRSVMHISIQTCFLFIFYNPYNNVNF